MNDTNPDMDPKTGDEDSGGGIGGDDHTTSITTTTTAKEVDIDKQDRPSSPVSAGAPEEPPNKKMRTLSSSAPTADNYAGQTSDVELPPATTTSALVTVIEATEAQQTQQQLTFSATESFTNGEMAGLPGEEVMEIETVDTKDALKTSGVHDNALDATESAAIDNDEDALMNLDDINSITSSEEKYLLEGNFDDEVSNASDMPTECASESKNKNLSFEPTEETQAKVAKSPEPVNFDLILSANDSSDGSSSQRNVNISQVVSSVIDKLQTEDESASGTSSPNQPATQNEATDEMSTTTSLTKKLPLNGSTPTSEEGEKKDLTKVKTKNTSNAEKTCDQPSKDCTQQTASASAITPKVFSHQIKSSFYEKRLKLIEATNDCYEAESSVKLPIVKVIPNKPIGRIDTSVNQNVAKIGKTAVSKTTESDPVEAESLSDADTVMLDEGNFDSDLEEESRWVEDSSEDKNKKNSGASILNLQQLRERVDHNLAYQMQLEMDRDPRALEYYYGAHGEVIGVYKKSSKKSSKSTASSTSSALASSSSGSSNRKNTINAICASTLEHMNTSATVPLTPGPSFENTSLVKSSKFMGLEWLAKKTKGGLSDDNDDDINDFVDDENDVIDEEDDDDEYEEMETDEGIIITELDRQAMMGAKSGSGHKGGRKSLKTTHGSENQQMDQGTQWSSRFRRVDDRNYSTAELNELRLVLYDPNKSRSSGGNLKQRGSHRRPPPFSEVSAAAIASNQRRLQHRKLRTIVPTKVDHQKQPVVAEVAPNNGAVVIAEITEAEAQAQAEVEARMLRNQQHQDSSRALALAYNGEYAGDFDEALRAALAASMETAEIEQMGGSCSNGHGNDYRQQKPRYSSEYFESVSPPNSVSEFNFKTPVSKTATAVDHSEHSTSTDPNSGSLNNNSSGVNDENRAPSQHLFANSNLSTARQHSRGMYNLQLHHQSRLSRAKESGKDTTSDKKAIVGSGRSGPSNNDNHQSASTGSHCKVRFAARENVIYPAGSTSPLAGDTFSEAVASVSPSISDPSKSTYSSISNQDNNYQQSCQSVSLDHPYVCFLCPRVFKRVGVNSSQANSNSSKMSISLLEHMQLHTYECLRCFHCGRSNFQSVDELREHMLENVSVSRINGHLASERIFGRRWTLLYLKMMEEGLHINPHFGNRAAESYTKKLWCGMCSVAVIETGEEEENLEGTKALSGDKGDLATVTSSAVPGTTVLQTALTSPFTPASSASALARTTAGTSSSPPSLSPPSTKTATRYEVLNHLCRHIAYWRYVCALCLEQGVKAYEESVENISALNMSSPPPPLPRPALLIKDQDADAEDCSGKKQPMPGIALALLATEDGLNSLEDEQETRQLGLEYRRATERCCFTVVEPVGVLRHMMSYHYKNYGRQAEDADLIVRWVASGPAEQYIARSMRDILNLTKKATLGGAVSTSSLQLNNQLEQQERYSKLDLDWMMRGANELGWNILVAASTDPTMMETVHTFVNSPTSQTFFTEPAQGALWERMLRADKRLNASLRKSVRQMFPDRNNNSSGSGFSPEVINLEDDDDEEMDLRAAASALVNLTDAYDNGYEAEGEMNDGSSVYYGDAKKRRISEVTVEGASLPTDATINLKASSTASSSSSTTSAMKTSSILPSPPTSLPEEEAENSRPKRQGKYRLPCFLCRIFFDIRQVDVFVRHMESAHLLPSEMVGGRRWAHLFAATFIKKRQREKAPKKDLKCEKSDVDKKMNEDKKCVSDNGRYLPLPWFEWCPMCTLLTPPSKMGMTEADCDPSAPINSWLVFSAADHFAEHFSYLRYRCLLCDKSNQRPFDVLRNIDTISGKPTDKSAGEGCPEPGHCRPNHQNGADFPLLFRSHISFVNPLTVADHLEKYHKADYRLMHAADVIFRREMNVSFLERMFLDMYRRTGNKYVPEKFLYNKEETNIFVVKMHREELLHKFELTVVDEKFEKEYYEKNFPITRTLHNLPYLS